MLKWAKNGPLASACHVSFLAAPDTDDMHKFSLSLFIHSEGHRSDMSLDLSGLTREERSMVQAPITNERNFCRLAEALIIQHPRKRTKGKGKDVFKRVDNPDARWFRGKGKSKHTGSGKSGASAHDANLVEDYDYYYDEDLDESANAYQAKNQLILETMTEKLLRITIMWRKTIRFLHMLFWMTSLFSEAAEPCRPRSRSECATGTSQCTSLPFLWRRERER